MFLSFINFTQTNAFLLLSVLKQLERELMELQASGRIQASKVSSSWNFEYEKPDGDVESPDETPEESSLEQLFLHKLDALIRRINFWNNKLQEYVHLVKGARAAV